MSDMAEEQLDEVESEVINDTENVADVTAEDEEAELVVSIGDASPASEEVEQAHAPVWVKELRKNHRELQRKNRELEDKLKATQTPAEIKVELGNKPKLENCDYDTDKYDVELSNWYDRKRTADEQTLKIKEKQEAENKAWQDKRASYDEAKMKLKVSDYEEAEHVALEMFSTTQQAIILSGADNPALVVYAIGKNPTKAKELAAITDPVKYAFAVAKLEAQLKVTKRTAPAPETPISRRGSASISGSVDSTLERLRSEAEKTGNYTKVAQYKRQRASK